MTPTRAQYHALCKAEGVEAICRDGIAFLLVRVRNLSLAATGVKLQIEVIDDLASAHPISIGYVGELSSSWDVFSFDADEWHASYGNWHLYLNPDLIRSIKAKVTWKFRLLPRSMRRSRLDKLLFKPR